MTVEEIKKEIERMQDVTKDIKMMVGNLRTDINRLEGAIKQDNDEFEAQLSEAESRGYQGGYEAGFIEGRTRKGLSEEKDKSDYSVRVGDEVIAPSSGEYGRAVVTRVIPRPNNRTAIEYLYSSGDRGWEYDTNLNKTGRHFDQMEELLEAMRL